MIRRQDSFDSQGRSGLLDWQLGYQADRNIVLLQTSGPIDKTSFPAMLAAALAIAKRHQCLRILADHRNSVFKLEPLEIYYAPRVIMGSAADSSYCSAMVFSQMTEDLQFMENVCRNSGLHLAVFTDIASALQWLNAPSNRRGTHPEHAAVKAGKSKS